MQVKYVENRSMLSDSIEDHDTLLDILWNSVRAQLTSPIDVKFVFPENL